MEREATAELLAALAYGERRAGRRALDNVRFAPDQRRAEAQRGIAAHEERNGQLIEARLAEVGSADLTRRFEPFFDAFFTHTEPSDWVEAQAFHYVGDALVSDFAETLVELVDPVSAEIVRHTLGEREDQEGFALEEDPRSAERVAAYSRKIVGEGLTQTARALGESALLRELLAAADGERRWVLDLLDRHRARLDRLGIERIEADSFD